MDGLLIATGFTGALTLVWLARRAAGLLWPAPTATAYFSPGGGWVEALVGEIKAARKEVLLQAPHLACRPVAQALVDARLRRATVEVTVGPGAGGAPDMTFLREQGLEPRVSDRPLGAPVVLIDGRVLLASTFPLAAPPDGDGAVGQLFVIKGHPEVVTACRQAFPPTEAPPAVTPGVEAPRATISPPPRLEIPAPVAVSPPPRLERPAPMSQPPAPPPAVVVVPVPADEGPDPLEALARANAATESAPRARPAQAEADLMPARAEASGESAPSEPESVPAERPRAPTMKAAIELMERLRREAALADKEEEGDEKAA